NMSSKEVINLLQQIDVDVSNHMATITSNVIKQLDEKIDGGKKKETSSKPNQTNKNHKTKEGSKERSRPSKQNVKNKKKKNQKEVRKTSKSETPKEIKYHGTLTVDELAGKLNVDTSEIIKKLMFLGVMATKNQDLDDDAIELICSEYGVEAEKEVILEDTD